MRTVSHVILSLTLLFIGGSIYILFRPESLLMFRWADTAGLMPLIDSLRDSFGGITAGYVFTYCLPDGLWTASYLLMAHTIISAEHKVSLIFWSYSLPGIAVLFEFLQLAGVIPGVFDIYDIMCFLIPITLYSIFLHYEKVF